LYIKHSLHVWTEGNEGWSVLTNVGMNMKIEKEKKIGKKAVCHNTHTRTRVDVEVETWTM